MNLSSLVDGLLPVVLWLLGSQNSTEVQQVIDGLRTLIRARAEDLASFIRHDVLLFARGLLKPLTGALAAVPFIGIIVTLLVRGSCGPVNAPIWMVCSLLLLAIFVQAPSLWRIYQDRHIRPSDFDLNRGRVGREADYDDYTDAEKDREAALLGFVRRTDAQTMADTRANFTPAQRAEEIATRNRHLDQLRARRPVPPLMDVQDLIRAYDAIGAAEATQTSVLSYCKLALFGAFSEYVLTLLAVHALGSYSSPTAGIAPIYVDMLGLVHVGAFYLALASVALAVLLPVAVVGAILSVVEQPVGGTYELIVRVLPGVVSDNAVAIFGRPNVNLYRRMQAFITERWDGVQAAMGVLTAIALVKAGGLALVMALVFAFVAAAMYKNQEVVGVDTLPTRRARALRLETWVMVGLGIKFAILLTTYFAPTWTADVAYEFATFINGVVHVAQNAPAVGALKWYETGFRGAWWTIKFIAILVALVVVYSAFFGKNATTWGKRTGSAVAFGLVVILVGMTGAIPNIDAVKWRNRLSLACPGTLPPLPPEPVEAAPPPLPAVTASTNAPPPSVAPAPPPPRHGHRRRANRGTTVVLNANVASPCRPPSYAPSCSSISDPGRRENARAFCGCR